MGWKEFREQGPERRKRLKQKIKLRAAAVFVLGVMAIKPFPFLWSWWPDSVLRNMAKYWTYSMLWTFVRTGGMKVIADQPSFPRIPTVNEPKAKVESKWQLSEAQIKYFWDNGFIAPLKLCEPEEMAEMLREVEEDAFEPGETGFEYGKMFRFTPSKIYDGIRNGRDRHLDCPAVMNLALHPGVSERVAQLLGPDLLLWRTQLLPKFPGAPETAWHQVSTFTMSGRMLRPVLEPPDRDELFNVTAWLALEDVDLDNGCMQFWAGSHKKPLHHVKILGSQTFARTSFELEANIPKNELIDCVLKAGEFVIFHERTVHGAPPNSSKTRRRFGMNYRICRPDVFIYRGMTRQMSNTFEEQFDLKNWTAIQLRGEDRLHRNKVKQPEEVLKECAALARRELVSV